MTRRISARLLPKVFAMWFVVCVGTVPGLAYEVAKVDHGGTIFGRVNLIGEAPKPKAFNLITFPDPEYCGRISNGKGWRLFEDFTVSSEGGLKGVVVAVEGVEQGKPFSLSIPRVEARDCQFLPYTTVVRDGHGVEVVNMDPVMHDVQAYETSRAWGARVLFNSPLPFNHEHVRGDLHAMHDHQPGRSMVRQFRLSKNRRMFMMQCGFHAYMISWAFAVENPYYAITDAEGKFSIDHIPPGTYRLRVWHPYVTKRVEQVVTIEADGAVELSLDLPAPVDRRTVYTVQRPPRFGPGAIGRPSLEIHPLVKKQ